MHQIRDLAAEVCTREGCKLYDTEFTGTGTKRILRIYIDKPGDRVGVDDCANVSRGLSLLLDVHDIVQGAQYELEVSSPGLERALKEPWHFEQVVGQPIRLHLKEPEAMEPGRAPTNSVVGILQRLEGEQLVVSLESKDEERIVALNNVGKAQVIFELGTKAGSIKKKSKR